MRLGILFSGGKDSCLAIHRAGELHHVACLITIVSRNPESYMFHTPNIHLAELQAEAMEIPIVKVETAGVKEEELEDLRRAIRIGMERYGIEGIATGTLASTYQSTRIQRICDELALWCFNPLWMRRPLDILNELVSLGYEVIISGVFAYPFTEDYLGKRLDEEMIRRLVELERIHAVNPSGEGGEIETTVLSGPIFKERLEILHSEMEYRNYAGVFRVLEARVGSQ